MVQLREMPGDRAAQRAAIPQPLVIWLTSAAEEAVAEITRVPASPAAGRRLAAAAAGEEEAGMVSWVETGGVAAFSLRAAAANTAPTLGTMVTREPAIRGAPVTAGDLGAEDTEMAMEVTAGPVDCLAEVQLEVLAPVRAASRQPRPGPEAWAVGASAGYIVGRAGVKRGGLVICGNL